MLSHACVGFQALGILVRSPWLPISPWQACSWVQTGQPGRIFCPYGLLPLASAVKWASSSLSFSEVPNWTMSLGTLSAQKPRTMNLRALGGNSGGAKSVVGGEGRGEFCRSECSSQALVFCSFFSSASQRMKHPLLFALPCLLLRTGILPIPSPHSEVKRNRSQPHTFSLPTPFFRRQTLFTVEVS